jgi:hypothetical protein
MDRLDAMKVFVVAVDEGVSQLQAASLAARRRLSAV